MSRRDWQLRVVACIDSALNSWRENLPTVLRWTPDQTDAELRDQAMLLAAALYLAQIQVSRSVYRWSGVKDLIRPFTVASTFYRSAKHVAVVPVTYDLRQCCPNMPAHDGAELEDELYALAACSCMSSLPRPSRIMLISTLDGHLLLMHRPHPLRSAPTTNWKRRGRREGRQARLRRLEGDGAV